MTAGLFAAHGVHFGHGRPGDEHNPRGYFEHWCLVAHVMGGLRKGWPAVWWASLEAEGWTGGPWGAKKGPAGWDWVRDLNPAVVVLCERPEQQIRASRQRWGMTGRRIGTPASTRRGLERVVSEARCPVVRVPTPELVAGKYDAILPAFDLLGVRFSPDVAAAWIDPALWGRGAKR